MRVKSLKGHGAIRTVSIILVLVLIVLTASISCQRQSSTSEKVGVAVTILPLVEFVKAVGGEKIDAFTMVPPGANPHAYEPVPSQIRKLAEAKMYVKVGAGLGFELAWMDKLAAVNRGMLVVDSSKGIELIASKDPDEPGADSHIWVSPLNAKTIVRNIYQGLVQIDSKNEAYYSRNRDDYINKLDELDKDIKGRLKNVQNRQFIVFHPAWGYFARNYQLEQIPIEVQGKEPSAQDIARLVAHAKAQQIKVIFASPQFNPNSAEVIAREIGGKVVFIDQLAGDYMKNLRAVVEEMAQAME